MLITLAGCFTFKADREYLEGEWTDFVKDPHVISYWEGDETTITFKNDSFYYAENRWSDFVSLDPCSLTNAQRTSFGRYYLSGDKLSLNGVWGRVPYNKDKAPCFDTGAFILIYKITGGNMGSIDLQFESSNLQNKTLRYKEKLTLYKK